MGRQDTYLTADMVLSTWVTVALDADIFLAAIL